MTYAVQADMSTEFGDVELAQLCDRTNGTTLDAPAVAVLNGALSRADDEIDSYLAQRYLLPFATVPKRLKSIAMDIARFYLYDARAPQIVQDRYKAAITWLQAVAAGKAVVGVDATANMIQPASGAAISVQAGDQVFTDDVLALQ